MKFSAGICGVGKWLQIWKQCESLQCPICEIQIETTTQVLSEQKLHQLPFSKG